ncbi:MAG: hypothetical protein JXA96_08600 [Sedimentisphaerales bacterium]|nr:hypothetical protein [Sedimentisphaerales bacterium]
MKSSEEIKKLIKDIPINTSSVKDKQVLDDVIKAMEESKKQPAIKPNIWRIIMQSKIVKLTAAAVILFAVILGINFLGMPIDGASTAFAAAMDSIKQARTFSCTVIMEVNYEDNNKRGTYLNKDKVMFKEPYWKRKEQLTSPWPQYVGEITIHDYEKRKELYLRPAIKEAILYDLSSSYYFDEKTGILSLTQLDTGLRDYLIEKSAGTFDDLGEVELNGKTVWKLQEKKKNRICTLWINPETNYPVQIELKYAGHEESPILYTEIKIDEELDDELFSLAYPEDYYFKDLGNGGWEDYQKKLVAKIMKLGLFCVIYRDKYEGQFPDELSNLAASGIVTDDVLKNLLAPPDNPDGYPVFKYNKPAEDSDWATTIILYEVYNQWPEEGVVTCFVDGHSEIITDQSKFEKIIK